MESQVTRRGMIGGAATFAGGAALLAAPGAIAAPRRRSATPTPEGFRKLLVYIAEGPASAGSITDPDAVVAFQRRVMGRNRAELAAYVEQAKRFFRRRFGLDFSGVDALTPVGPWEIDGATLAGSVFDPGHGYTAHIVSEEWVGEEGWTVRDASFGVSITEDRMLNGTWGGAAGKPVRAGSFVVFGDYNIKADRPGRGRDGTIMIHFESGSPIVADVDGRCTSSAISRIPGGAAGTRAEPSSPTAASATCSPSRRRSHSERRERPAAGGALASTSVERPAAEVTREPLDDLRLHRPVGKQHHAVSLALGKGHALGTVEAPCQCPDRPDLRAVGDQQDATEPPVEARDRRGTGDGGDRDGGGGPAAGGACGDRDVGSQTRADHRQAFTVDVAPATEEVQGGRHVAQHGGTVGVAVGARPEDRAVDHPVAATHPPDVVGERGVTGSAESGEQRVEVMPIPAELVHQHDSGRTPRRAARRQSQRRADPDAVLRRVRHLGPAPERRRGGGSLAIRAATRRYHQSGKDEQPPRSSQRTGHAPWTGTRPNRFCAVLGGDSTVAAYRWRCLARSFRTVRAAARPGDPAMPPTGAVPAPVT